MRTRLYLFLISFILVLSMIPCQEIMAVPPLTDCAYKHKVPQDFIWWVNDKQERGSIQDKYIKAYKKEQGYLLAPQIGGAVLDDVCWGYDDVTVNYGFHNGDASWRIYVYPLKDCKEEYFYSEDIVTLVDKKDGGIELNKKKEYTYIYDSHQAENSCTVTDYYEKKELQLGDDTTVDCVQETWHKKYLYQDLEVISVYLHFFKSGMYVRVSGGVSAAGQENSVADALKKCTFKKMPTNSKLTLSKKKNKVTKKNVILNAILQNPTNKDFTYVELYFYDKKKKKYRIVLRRKVTEKSQKKEKVALKFNVQKIIKDWRKRRPSRGKNSFPLERKTKYKYKIRAKVNGEYLEAAGNFKLK